ncbi:MAG: toxin-antitoxin system YwqK family antitoxin [Marinifilaceae bacterium]
MRLFLYFLLLSFTLSSCDLVTAIKKQVKSQKTDESSASEGVSGTNQSKNGRVKYYYENGGLKSVVNYENGVKVGVSHTYYPSGEKQYEIPYKNGMKDGIVKWFYKEGSLYRETSYEKGVKNGLQKFYWGNGVLKAEILYRNNMPAKGLKEYSNKGFLKKQPRIVVETVDLLAQSNEYLVKFRLSDESSKVQFYIGELLDGVYLPQNVKAHLAPINTEKGVGIIRTSIPRGNFIKKTLHVIAVKKTSFKNQLILTTDYNLSVVND